MANYRKSFNLRNGVQVDDDNFIVNANGLVGIGTSVPTEFLDVHGNAKITGLVTTNHFYAGIATVGFLTATNIRTSGVITATTFYGSAAGLTGISAVAVDGWYISGGNISTTSNVGIGTTLPQGSLQIGVGITFNSNGNTTYSGIVTATSFNGTGANITSINASNISSGTLSNSRLPSNINISGIVTATSGFVGDITGNVTGNLTGNVTGNITGTASTAQSLTGTPNITVGVVTASSIGVGVATVGISTVFTTSHVGSGGTAFSVLNSGKIGVGTALPTSELQIIKSSGTLLEVISNSGQARISIGQSVGVGKNTGVLRFGDVDRTLDIINNDTGNLNYYLHAGPAGVGTGRFEWIYGQTNAQLMSLTYAGRLGLGKTNPDNTLHVVGTSTVTGNAWFGGNVTVSGNVIAAGFNLPSILSNTNLNNSSGVSTFYNVRATNNFIVSTGASIGIGTESPIVTVDARGQTGLFGSIGIGTTSTNQTLKVTGSTLLQSVAIGNTNLDNGSGVNVYGGTTTLSSNTVSGINSCVVILDNTSTLGVGTTSYRSALDFGDAGKNSLGGVGAYMIVPRLTNAQRTGLSTVAGAFIFNIDTSKFQGYTGTGWTDFH